jgi:hypothetical protein
MKNIHFIFYFSSFLISFAACKDKECAINCQNGGTCVNNSCNCPNGWTGTDCSTPSGGGGATDTIYFTINGVKFSKGTISGVTSNTAYILSDFTTITGVQVSNHGHCWSSTNSVPTVNDNFTSKGALSTPVSFTSQMSNLLPNTKYYARTYCVVNGQTFYHERVVAFTTLSPQSATLVTGTASNITTNSASIFGNISNIGTYAATQHGHCWSTFSNPTVNDNKTQLGVTSTAVAFTSNLTNLQEYTTYYVRAYAISQNGQIGYGDEITLTTRSSIAVRDGLLSYYTFDGGNANDIIGSFNGNNFGVTFNNQTPNGAGLSAVFNGTSSYIHVVQTRTYSELTINLWIKSTDADAGLVGAKNTFGSSLSGLNIAQGKLYTSSSFTNSLANNLLNGQWHMLTYMCCDGRYYIDGVLQESLSGHTTQFNDNQTMFGTYNPTFGLPVFLAGNLDNIRFYTRILSQVEIQQIYNARQ